MPTVRCPGCFGKGTVSSPRAALRSVVGRLTPDDFGGDENLFDMAKDLYSALTLKTPPSAGTPKKVRPSGGTTHSAPKQVTHSVPKEATHLGPYKWKADCGCGFSVVKGQSSSAIRAIEDHVRKETP